MKLLLALLITMLPAAASERIDQLKSYLGQREQIARIYMPQQATQGEPMQVLVLAPGASSVTLLGSRANSGLESELGLQLGADPLPLATAALDASGRASLALNIPVKPVVVITNQEESKAEKKKSKKEKSKKVKAEPDIYYIEAVIEYPNGDKRKAMIFGASANYIGFNGVQVVPPVKDNGGAASMARSFVPGMAGLPVGNY